MADPAEENSRVEEMEREDDDGRKTGEITQARGVRVGYIKPTGEIGSARKERD